MQNFDAHLNQARTWVRQGFARLRAEPTRWLGMTLVYLVVALVLKRIPFLGNFVLVFVTPIAFASAMLAARSVPWPRPSDLNAWLRALSVDAARELVQVFRREEHGFAIIIVCVVTLGLVVVLNIPELLVTGGSVVSGVAGASLGGPLRFVTVVGMIVVIGLYLLLTMALFYVIPLVLFAERQAIPAVIESFKTCLHHYQSLGLFVAPFVLINLAIMIAFSLSHLVGYVLLAAVGVVALPVFVLGVHASYLALFESSATTP